MKLSQLPDGESIFLDANIFQYSAFDHPTFGGACKDFLARVDQEEVQAIVRHLSCMRSFIS